MSDPIDYAAAAEKIADELQGTANSLHGVLEENEMDGFDMNSDFCARLDSLVFECACCGRWCEISEMTDDPEQDWTCDECAE